MFALSTGAWIDIALLAPFWWGVVLFLLALFGDVASRRRPVSRLFDRLERPFLLPPSGATEPAPGRETA